MIQQYLLNIGIEVVPRIATWAELATIRQQGDFDLIQLSYDLVSDPYAALYNFFHSSQTAPSGETSVGQNYFRYRNEELDAIIEQIGVETDEETKTELTSKRRTSSPTTTSTFRCTMSAVTIPTMTARA